MSGGAHRLTPPGTPWHRSPIHSKKQCVCGGGGGGRVCVRLQGEWQVACRCWPPPNCPPNHHLTTSETSTREPSGSWPVMADLSVPCLPGWLAR